MLTPQVIITPTSSPEQLAEGLIEVQRILTRGLGIGDAGESVNLLPRTVVGTTRPATRLGRVDNLLGSMVEVTLTLPTDLNVNIECYHSLNLPGVASRVGRSQALNVRWLVVGLRYLNDNYTANMLGVGNSVSVMYANGVVGTNSVELRFYTTLSSAGNGGLVVSLLFFPSSR